MWPRTDALGASNGDPLWSTPCPNLVNGDRTTALSCTYTGIFAQAWIANVDGEFYPAKYYFTVDYTDSEVADDPAQHKQSHVLELLDAGQYTGNIVALPNNRVRVTHPAWFETAEGAPDFRPNQNIFHSKEDINYVWDTQRVFNNLYSDKDQEYGYDEEEWNEEKGNG